MNPTTDPSQFNVPGATAPAFPSQPTTPQSTTPQPAASQPTAPQSTAPSTALPPNPTTLASATVNPQPTSATPQSAPFGLQASGPALNSSTIYGSAGGADLLAQQQAAMNTIAAAKNTPIATTAQPQAAIGSNTVNAAPTVHENPLSTQATLLISELRDSLVIMKDGSFRAVVACQSINFDLMSETEREGVEYSYQNFLNSLNFTTQILIRSQRVDIGPYIDRLTTIRRNNDNMLLGVLMDDYINFIDMLSQEANIMDKSFFIVIPYYSSADAEQFVNQTKNLFRGFSKKPPEVTRINRETYNKAIDELNNRVETVVSGLFQIGIQSVRLNTKELSELYYNFNNPDTAIREPLVDFSKLATTYVRKGDKTNA